MTFRIGRSLQCQTIYHAKIPYQPKNYFSTMKNTRFRASPVLEVLDAPYCSYSPMEPNFIMFHPRTSDSTYPRSFNLVLTLTRGSNLARLRAGLTGHAHTRIRSRTALQSGCPDGPFISGVSGFHTLLLSGVSWPKSPR